MKKRDVALCGAVSVIALLYGPAALAQTPGVSSGPDDRASASLAEVVVTAEKRSARLQDVPVTVAAVSSETLNKAGVDSTAGLISLVPGLNINNSLSGFRPYLRGVGTTSSAAGNENSVSTYVDNVYLASMNAGLLNLSSIESIEVLKGPQGTLFGRNATGGVIHIKTKEPSHTFGGDGSVSYDNYDTLVGTGYITGGLTDTLAADFAVYYKNQGQGYGHNLHTGDEVNKDRNIVLRSKWRFTPTDVDTFTLAVDYSRSKSSGNNAYTPVPGTTVNWGGVVDATHPPSDPARPFLGSAYTYTGGPWDVDMAIDPFFRSWATGGSLTYEHEFSWATLSSFTAFRESKIRQAWNATPIPINAQYAGWTQPEQQFTQELQLSSRPESKVKWILGAYYINAWVKYQPFFIAGTALGPIEQQFRMKQSIESPAIYGQVTVPVEALGDTNLTGGLRYTIDKRAIVGEIDIVSQADHMTPLRPPVSPIDTDRTFKTFTWRLSLDHHFNRDVMVYASYNRGFKAGAFNSIPPSGPSTNPEILDAFEVGMKNTLLDGKATFNASAFYYKYRDLQVTTFDQGAAKTLNAARAEIKGIDVDFKYQVTENLLLAAGAEFLDHKYVSFPSAPLLTINPVANGGGVTRIFGSAKGNPLSYTSDAVINASAYYKVPTSYGDLDFNVNVVWNDGFAVDPSTIVKADAFYDVNASAGWTAPNRATRVSVFGRNLANEKIVRVINTGANPGGYVEAQYRPPRTYGVSISQKF